jgi:hypothetical protein
MAGKQPGAGLNIRNGGGPSGVGRCRRGGVKKRHGRGHRSAWDDWEGAGEERTEAFGWAQPQHKPMADHAHYHTSDDRLRDVPSTK